MVENSETSDSVKAKILNDNAKANGMYIDRVEISMDVELDTAADTIKLLNDTLAYALSFLTKDHKEEVMNFMEKTMKDNEGSDD